MAREWIVVWAGRHRRDRWDALCEDYRERLSRFMPARELAVRSRRTSEGAGSGLERLAAEGEAILESLPDPCRLIALDRDARPSSSESLAELLVSTRAEWPHPVVFAIGSDLGLAPTVLARAWRRLSFGPLTLPHELARLVLWEQLYRVSAIATGSGYHRKSAGSLV